MSGIGRRAACALALFAALPLAPMRAGAQEEPTPFWLPAEPEPPKRKPKQRPKPKKPPPDDAGASIYVAPGAEEPAPRKRKAKQKPEKAPPARPKARPEPEPEPATEPEAPAPKKRRFEPLPPLPHLEPELPVRKAEPPPAERRPAAPEPPPRPMAEPPRPAPEPARRVERPPREVFNPEEEAPRAAPKPPPGPAEPAPEPRPIPLEPRPAPRAEPARPPPLPAIPAAEPEPRKRPEPVVVEPAPEPEPEAPAAPLRWRRAVTVLAVGSLWQKPRGDGRAFEVAYGLQAGWAPIPWLLIDLTALRAGSTQGNSFASASTTHTLFAARLWAAWNKGLVSLFAGGGFGGAFSQTRYSLQDVNQPESTLDANALKLAGQAGVGARLRPWRGLEVRVEVTSLLRDGRLEPLLIGGAGWAF